MRFVGLGFYGSPEAAMSYAPDENAGHLWLVDTERGRDCKGEWSRDGAGWTWRIYCEDGPSASGAISDPGKGQGNGFGNDAEGRPLFFLYSASGD